MTSTPADTERKVRQLENDVDSIYDILARIEKTQGDHSGQLTDLAAGQSRVGAKLARQANRLDELAVGQEAHATELIKIQTTQQRQNNRLDELAATQDEHGTALSEHGTILTQHTTVLNEHTTVLSDHTTILSEQSMILAEQSTVLSEQSTVLSDQSTVLVEHGGKLDTILELLRTG